MQEATALPKFMDADAIQWYIKDPRISIILS